MIENISRLYTKVVLNIWLPDYDVIRPDIAVNRISVIKLFQTPDIRYPDRANSDSKKHGIRTRMMTNRLSCNPQISSFLRIIYPTSAEPDIWWDI